MKVPASRPADFYAEMYKTDKQMFNVRQFAAEERETLNKINSWKNKQKGKDGGEQDLEDILNNRKKPETPQKVKVKKKFKQEAKDKKFGFGGKKRFSRQNDKKSLDNDRKGKGKGKGGKGKGKGKSKGKK